MTAFPAFRSESQFAIMNKKFACRKSSPSFLLLILIMKDNMTTPSHCGDGSCNDMITDGTCSICLEDFGIRERNTCAEDGKQNEDSALQGLDVLEPLQCEDRAIARMPCGHYFCTSCIRGWLAAAPGHHTMAHLRPNARSSSLAPATFLSSHDETRRDHHSANRTGFDLVREGDAAAAAIAAAADRDGYRGGDGNGGGEGQRSRGWATKTTIGTCPNCRCELYAGDIPEDAPKRSSFGSGGGSLFHCEPRWLVDWLCPCLVGRCPLRSWEYLG